ncbi:palmitoyltransferase pfa5 [Coccidioides immitis RS]|uniref:Palmitoyltransferase n=1 Tax=Coccidioides immitis (strain RS) TaxID=246410 RepID=J3K8U9_COCIM|nr:palmitoyltransferase pfa5 [Coccidioides immitis RS]EAS31280.3 palmitoyltransferase pfa5 [Coccidioides immitis RS]
MASDKRVNIGAARVIPVVLGGLLAYGSYVFTRPLCIDYFISPPLHYGAPSPRRGLATGLLIVFYLLLLVLAVSYFRVITTIIWNPGFLQRGNQWHQSRTGKPEGNTKRRKRRHRPGTSYPDNANVEHAPYPIDAYGLEAFYCKDIFVCEQDGRPPWCSTCCQWKTDRAHHCSEVDRCTRKLDHFCPWVGGVISESSFKFFIQFLFYTFLFTTFNVVVFSIVIAEYRRNSGYLEVQWLVALALCGLFCLFSFGMLVSSLHLAFINSSTIESLTRHTKVWTLAVLIPRPKDFYELQSRRKSPIPVVIYPSSPIPSSSSSTRTATSNAPPREFAILSTKPGENPFDLGSPLANLKEVMGHSLIDWLLPLRYSPCSGYGSQESAYAFGPVVQRLKKENGLDCSE